MLASLAANGLCTHAANNIEVRYRRHPLIPTHVSDPTWAEGSSWDLSCTPRRHVCTLGHTLSHRVFFTLFQFSLYPSPVVPCVTTLGPSSCKSFGIWGNCLGDGKLAQHQKNEFYVSSGTYLQKWLHLVTLRVGSYKLVFPFSDYRALVTYIQNLSPTYLNLSTTPYLKIITK